MTHGLVWPGRRFADHGTRVGVPAQHGIGAAVERIADGLGIVLQAGQAIAAVLAAGQIHGDRSDPAGFKQPDGVCLDPSPEESAVDQYGRSVTRLAVLRPSPAARRRAAGGSQAAGSAGVQLHPSRGAGTAAGQR